MLGITYISTAQSLSYNDIGVLFSKENVNGTARFNGMSGAFGTLGGDLSAIDINPAGAAVFLKSEFSASLNIRNTENSATFYGNTELSETDNTDLSQAGGVAVFKTYNRNSLWNKVAFAFNYNMANDFENQWFVSGNSGYAPITDLYDYDPVVYVNTEGQSFENYTEGRNNKYTFTIASQYNDNLYVGASISSYDVDFYQGTLIEEFNNDGNGNTLDISSIQELSTFGDGIAFNLGFISKPDDHFRFGASYQSPVWYNLSEEFVDYDVELYYSDTDEVITDFSGVNRFDYKLRTPGKLTGSVAYIFNKDGLISLDYIYKDYSNAKLSGSNFSAENKNFEDELESRGEIRLGTEWRFDNFSVRGGYNYEKSPYKNASNSDDLEGFSLGAGYKFRGGKLDFSYQKYSNTAPYNFYGQYNSEVQSAKLDIDNSKFTATLTLNI